MNHKKKSQPSANSEFNQSTVEPGLFIELIPPVAYVGRAPVSNLFFANCDCILHGNYGGWRDYVENLKGAPAPKNKNSRKKL
jgi:hypothetical protein